MGIGGFDTPQKKGITRRLGFSRRFPGGSAGAGLLLLRLAIGLIAVVQGWCYLAGHDHRTFWMWPAGLLTLAGGAALVIGLLTPVASAVIAIGGICTAFSWLPVPAPNLLDGILPAALVIVTAVAISLLGPGALSVDARLFGFREIIIPRGTQTPRQ